MGYGYSTNSDIGLPDDNGCMSMIRLRIIEVSVANKR